MIEPGTVFGEYRIEEEIGRGGMGIVYMALHLPLDRPVALKVLSNELSADPEYRKMFRQEARSAALLDHPNVLPVYHAGEGPGGVLFTSMRLVRGPDLGRYLTQKVRLSPGEAVRLLTQVAEALNAAHTAGLVHRDVKPANVLLEPRDGGMQAYLSDFGLARPVARASEAAREDNIAGTLGYMSPEQIEGRPLDEAADVYAFGCLAYRCLVGRLPFERGSLHEVLIAHLNAPPPRPSDAVPGLAPILDLVVLRSLEKDPAQRARSPVLLMRRATDELSVDPVQTVREPHRDFRPANLGPARPALPERGSIGPSGPTRARRRVPWVPLAATMVALAAVATTSILLATASERADRGESGLDRYVVALQLSANTVRLSAVEAGLVERMANASDPAAGRVVINDLESVRGDTRGLAKRAIAQLSSSDQFAVQLRAALKTASAAAAALERVAGASHPADALGPASTARSSYQRTLQELVVLTGMIERGLTASHALSAQDKRAIEAMGREISTAGAKADAAFDALVRLLQTREHPVAASASS